MIHTYAVARASRMRKQNRIRRASATSPGKHAHTHVHEYRRTQSTNTQARMRECDEIKSNTHSRTARASRNGIRVSGPQSIVDNRFGVGVASDSSQRIHIGTTFVWDSMEGGASG